MVEQHIIPRLWYYGFPGEGHKEWPLGLEAFVLSTAGVLPPCPALQILQGAGLSFTSLCVSRSWPRVQHIVGA